MAWRGCCRDADDAGAGRSRRSGGAWNRCGPAAVDRVCPHADTANRRLARARLRQRETKNYPDSGTAAPGTILRGFKFLRGVPIFKAAQGARLSAPTRIGEWVGVWVGASLFLETQYPCGSSGISGGGTVRIAGIHYRPHQSEISNTFRYLRKNLSAVIRKSPLQSTNNEWVGEWVGIRRRVLWRDQSTY